LAHIVTIGSSEATDSRRGDEFYRDFELAVT
jgi:hypothetical protein